MNKTIVFGIDGADWRIIEPWLEAGELPNFKEALENGCRGELTTTLPFHTASCWTSFATGCNPGKHGIYNFVKYKNNFKGISPVDSTDIRTKTFYELIEKSGFAPTIINLPLSYPLRIESPVVTSFMSKSKEFLYPKELREEIDTSGFRTGLSSHHKALDVFNQSMKYIRSREEVLNYLWNRDWDFWFELFSPTDWMQHHVSHMKKKGPKLLKIYKEADKRIGRFLEEDANLFIMSDHGFRIYQGVFYLNAWLKRKGLLEVNEKEEPKSFWGKSDLVTKLVLKLGSNRFSRKMLYFLLDNFWNWIPLGNDAKVRIEEYLTPEIDIKNSKAFCPHNALKAIYINDERFYGKVKEKEQIIKKILEGLESKIGGEVHRKEEVYEGEEVKNAPDIVIEERKKDMCKNLSGRVERGIEVSKHRLHGIFTAQGPDIKKGIKKDVSIMDIAPTILELYGIEQDYMDGEVLKGILK